MCSGPTLTLRGSAMPPSAFQGPSNQIDNEGLWLYNTLWWSEHHQCVHVFGLSSSTYGFQCLVIKTKWMVWAATLTPSKSTIASSIVFLHIFYRKKHYITKTNSTTNFNMSAISFIIIVPLLITRTFPSWFHHSYSNSPSLVSSAASSYW